MDVHGIDHLEYYAGDADQAAGYLCDAFGFAIYGRGDPATGLTGCRSVLVRQHAIALLVTSALSPGHRADEYVQRHGDGIAVMLSTGSRPESPPTRPSRQA